jgi:hypothetical protein
VPAFGSEIGLGVCDWRSRHRWPEAADLVIERDTQHRFRDSDVDLGRVHGAIEVLRRAPRQVEKGFNASS